MKKLVFISLLAVLALVISGCSSTDLTARKSLNVNLADYKTFHVERLPADKRGIDVLIANRLKELGFRASTGDLSPSDKVDAIITYQDKWMWDITMYMIELTIQVRAPDTRISIASGRSFRTSLARRSPDEMVKETLDKIFEQK